MGSDQPQKWKDLGCPPAGGTRQHPVDLCPSWVPAGTPLWTDECPHLRRRRAEALWLQLPRTGSSEWTPQPAPLVVGGCGPCFPAMSWSLGAKRSSPGKRAGIQQGAVFALGLPYGVPGTVRTPFCLLPGPSAERVPTVPGEGAWKPPPTPLVPLPAARGSARGPHESRNVWGSAQRTQRADGRMSAAWCLRPRSTLPARSRPTQ